MRSDRYLLPLAVVFLIVQILWLAAELQFIQIPWIGSFEQKNNFPVVGSIVSTHNSTRRRSSEDIIWWDGRESDDVHAFDALLTLKNSAMKIKLNNGTDLSLSENTLVYIETLGGNSKDERIRIRFAHGNLRSKFGAIDGNINAQTWEINAEKNSEIKIKALDSGKLELDVANGAARATNGQNYVDIGRGEEIELGSNKEESRRKITNKIQWSAMNDHMRIYSHELPTPVKINWQGSAEKIQIEQSGKLLRELSVSENQEQVELPLNEGIYEVRLLAKDQRVSTWLALDVWRAPVIHLMAPLPRDRYAWSESLNYIWLKPSGVRTSQWELSRTETFPNLEMNVKTDGASLQKKGGEIGKFYWRVIGYDEDGFEIPAPYSNPIYFVPQPLAAPQLKMPELRVPASQKSIKNKNRKKHKTSFYEFKNIKIFSAFFKFILPEAYAQDQHINMKEDGLRFSWEKVDGADYYIIEISEKPDFRTTIVEKEIHGNEFLWPHIKTKSKKIYWRVASGGKNKMGRFSSVEEINLKKIKANDSGTASVQVIVAKKNHVKVPTSLPRKKVKGKTTVEAPLEALVENAEEAPIQTPTPTKILPPMPIVTPKIALTTSVSKHQLTLSYESTLLNESSGAVFNLAGPVLRYGYSYDHLLNKNWHMGYLAHAQVTSWKNVDSGLVVSGTTNLELRGRFSALLGKTTSPWAYSFGLETLAIPIRSGLENVSFDSQLMAGVGVWYVGTGRTGFSFSLNSDYSQATLYYNLLKPYKNGWTWGPEVELDSIQGVNNATSGLRYLLGVSAGFP